MAEGLRRGLEAEGFATDVAHTGPDGLWMAQEHPYDAIVLDLLLPGMNGYRVCAELREAEIWTPILMLTAKDGEFDEAEALDTGADDFVTKPFSFVALVARLRALIRRGALARPAVLAAGDLRLDPGGAARLAGRCGARLHRSRAGAARIPSAACRRGVLQDRDHRARLGRCVRGRREHRRGLRWPLAREARSPLRPASDRDDARSGLPTGGRRWMTGCAACGSARPSRRRRSSGSQLILAAVGLVTFVGRSLTGQVHDAAAARAQEVAARVADGRPLP